MKFYAEMLNPEATYESRLKQFAGGICRNESISPNHNKTEHLIVFENTEFAQYPGSSAYCYMLVFFINKIDNKNNLFEFEKETQRSSLIFEFNFINNSYIYYEDSDNGCNISYKFNTYDEPLFDYLIQRISMYHRYRKIRIYLKTISLYKK